MTEPRQPAGGSEWTRALKGAAFRTVLLYVGMGLLLVVAVLAVGEEIGHHIGAIDSWIAGLGPWRVFAFMGLFVVATSLFVPETVLAIMAGALFGMAEGLAVVIVGGITAATLQFLLSRWLLRARIQKTRDATPRLAALQHAVARSELRVQVLLRLTPLNPALLSIVFGAAGVRFPGFVLACLAIVPTQLVEVYFGHAGRHAAKMAGRHASALVLHDLLLFGGLGMCIMAMAVVSRMARRAVAETVADGAMPRDGP